MDGIKSYCLYPLYLIYNSKERFYRVNPEQLSKSFLQDLAREGYGLEDAFETCVFQKRHFGSKELTTISTEEDIALLKEEFASLHFAKITIFSRPAGAPTTTTRKENSKQLSPVDTEPEADVVSISAQQLDNLIKSIQKLEVSLNNKNEEVKPEEKSKSRHRTIHYDVICDGCNPDSFSYKCKQTETSSEAGFIKGPRYKCLYCHNYDLCSACVEKGVETGTHQKFHNMIKINIPDNDINKFWSEYRTSTSPKEARFAVHKTPRDVVIDIPEYDEKVFKFFSNIKNEPELSRVVEFYEKYSSLLEQVGGDESKLIDAVQLASSVNSSTATIASPIEALEGEEDDLIEVDMSKKDQVISFKLCNRSTKSISSGLKLVFQYFEKGNSIPIKCNLHMGPHEFQAGNYKILNFNYRGVIDNFSPFNRCQIDLVDQNDQLIFTGASEGSSNLILKPPMMASFQKTVYSEADTARESKSSESLEDEDIISTTVTNDDFKQSSNYDSEIDDYDFLSDSDIDL